jgi:hypothetical protein
MARTGSYSPAAKIAVDNFAALVATKSANTAASAAARSSFAEGPLTDFEKFAWLQFVDETVPSHVREPIPINGWKNLEIQELHDVMQTEPGFARFANKPEGVKFIHELKNAINEKYSQMLGTDKGMALVFRFDSAYSAVAHTAVASLWRDATGKLCMGVAHQESVPPSDAKTDVPRGVVYDKFDTSATFPGGFAPVVESMRLAGLHQLMYFRVRIRKPSSLRCRKLLAKRRPTPTVRPITGATIIAASCLPDGLLKPASMSRTECWLNCMERKRHRHRYCPMY